MPSNAKLGGDFEREFCKTLADNGFWVHRIERNVGGQQPADVIAVRNRYPVLIDCKVCTTGKFLFSRIEDNQRMAMDRWCIKAETRPYFALQGADGDIWMLDYSLAIKLESKGSKSIELKAQYPVVFPVEDWLEATP